MNQRVRRLSHIWLAAAAMLFGIAQVAGAQSTGNIAGRVLEAGTNAPIASAQVQVVGTTRGAVTNETGAYRIASIPAGQYTLRVMRIGFQSITQTVTVGSGETANADFSVPAVAIKLDEVVTTATGATERKRETGNAIGTLQPSIAEQRGQDEVSNPGPAAAGKDAGCAGREPGRSDRRLAENPHSRRGQRVAGQLSCGDHRGRAPQQLVRPDHQAEEHTSQRQSDV